MFEDDPKAKSFDLNGKVYCSETIIPIGNETFLSEDHRFAGGFSRRAVENREQKRKKLKPYMPVLTAI